MPQTINGIGTSYYGKKNLETDIGTCESCGHQGELHSYETGYYFVFLYIPIIPLGRKQIFDFCPRCSRHRVMPVEEWKVLKQQVIDESTAKLAENMDDPEAAVSHLQTLTAFHQVEEARELTGAIEGTHGGDVDVQLFLGSWHDIYGNSQDADRCFERAFQLDPKHPGCIRAHGVGLIEKGQIDEAKTVLQPLEPPSPDYDPAVFFMLASGYQEKKDHAGAMEVFQLIADTTPQFKKEKWFRQPVQASEKMLGKSGGESILPRHSILKSKALWAVAIAALLLIGLFWWNRHLANHQKIFVVNANSCPIEVVVDDGEPIHMSSRSHAQFTLPEGTHTVKVLKPKQLAESTFTLSKGWFERFFSKKTYVLDPTETAIVYVQTTTYVRKPAKPTTPDRFTYKAGQLLHEANGIDYPFERFPHEIEMESQTIERQRIDFLEPAPDILEAPELNLSVEDVDKIFRRCIKLQPDNLDYLKEYFRFSLNHQRVQKYVALLKEHHKYRPVEIQIHRLYQQQVAVSGEKTTEQLKDDYDKLIEQEKDNPDLLYLRGRLESDTKKVDVYSERALKLDPNHAFSLFSKAFCFHTRGEFQDAKRVMDRVIKSHPNDEFFKNFYRDVVLAAGTDREIDAVNGRNEQRTPNKFLEGYSRNAEALMARGDARNARVRFERIMASLGTYEEKTALAIARAHWAVLNRDEENFSFPQGPVDQKSRDYINYQLNLRVDSKKAADSLKKFLKGYSQLGEAQVLIAAALKMDGHDKQAEEFIDALKSKETFTEAEEIELIQLLDESRKRKIDVDEIRKLSVSIKLKRCYALATLVFSQQPNPELLKFARDINYDFAFPHHFIEDTLKKVEKRNR